MARSVCRQIAGDDVFQHFTREVSTKSSKVPLSTNFPRIHSVVVAATMNAASVGTGEALTGLSAHLARCSDRKSSKRRKEITK